MKCSYCRFELDNRQTVCPNCGAPIEYQTTLSHSVNVQKNTERSKAVYIWTAIYLEVLVSMISMLGTI